jgi:hypothetical protein
MTNNRALKLLMILATLWLGGPAIAQAQPANESLCGPLKGGRINMDHTTFGPTKTSYLLC